MTYQAVTAALSATGIPVTYGRKPTDTVPPYIVWMTRRGDAIAADGLTICVDNIAEVHLIEAKRRDFAAEALIETALDGLGVSWEREDVYDEEQKLAETVWGFSFDYGRSDV